MKDKTKLKIRIPEKKFRMYVKIILSTLKQAMRDCETYEEFKIYINSIFKEVSDNDK